MQADAMFFCGLALMVDSKCKHLREVEVGNRRVTCFRFFFFMPLITAKLQLLSLFLCFCSLLMPVLMSLYY